jgi:beta-glucosidase
VTQDPDANPPLMPTMPEAPAQDGAPALSEPPAPAPAVAAKPTVYPMGAHAPGIRTANFKFPAGFLWGASTSAQQVEGGNTLNDWYAWEQAGKVPTQTGAAADHYHRFREDFDLAKQLNHNAHRFSLEWSRIEPEEGKFSDEAIAHYRDVLEALRERGITPVVTLFHYTFPKWMADRGGWENPEVEKLFERYVSRVLDEYKDLARWWITLNEPVVQAFKGWLLGQWPPGKTDDFATALQVVRRMIRTHVIAYHAIHERRGDAMVSIAKHVLAFTPCNPDRFRDRLSVRFREYIFNQLFIDALHKGSLRVPGLFWERLPAGRTLDFIGLNYYTRDFVHNTGIDIPGLVGNTCPLDHHEHIGKRNSLGWEVYPEGLAHFLRSFKHYGLPLLITENGVPANRDEDRWTFIFMHLWQVARAIDEGANVVGYMYWSLLDNYEWADGYAARFGLVGVDFRTQKRTVHHSAKLFANLIRTNEL